MSMVADSVRFSPDEARAAARDFDLKRLPADFIDDPFAYYRALREHDPLHRMPDGAYLITRWRDCDAVYRDAQTFSSDKGRCKIHAYVPLAMLFGYTSDLRNATSGKASFTMEPSHYAAVREELADIRQTA